MRRHPGVRAARPAAAAVEFALVLTVLMPLLIGVWEIGRLVNAYQVVMNSTREAGRQAATGIQTNAQIRQIVLTYMQNNGLSKITSIATDATDLQNGNKVLIDITVYDSKGVAITNGDPKIDGQQMYKINVTVTVLYKDIEYSPTSYYLQPDFNVTASVSWNCMKDKGLSVNDVIPLY